MNGRFELNGKWMFCKKDKYGEWKEGIVPGCVQMDLMRLGEMPDPFFRMDEIKMRKLEDKEWVYRKEFELDGISDESAAAYLVFEGVDTLADVYLNGVYLGKADNMFIPFRYKVDGIIRKGNNCIEVYFDSPVTSIKTIEQNSPLKLISYCDSSRCYIRKAQFSYGWDWGPRITQVGLWRSVYLEVIENVKISYPYFHTLKIEGNTALVRVGVEIESYCPEILESKISISLKDKKVFEKKAHVVHFKGTYKAEVLAEINDAQLWYPAGIGGQPLYDIQADVLVKGMITDSFEFRSGIRTIKLVRESDTEGESFIFEINGIKVFAKGSNWVPGDSLLPRVTKEDYYYYIRMAAEANMNMLRVWGGGIYESPYFYEACDEMGIMIWHDFMYACAQYPDHFDWFRNNAEREATEVVKFLRVHPSIILWCGSNENSWFLHARWNGGNASYLGNCIYKQILPSVCSENDPSRPYWVSSPYGGEDPNSATHGDRHSWEVWYRWNDYDEYKNDNGRFLSEFGLLAMPNWKTILSFTEPEDRHVLSPVMLCHNKMAEGVERLVRYMVGRLGFPKGFREFVYLSQFLQGEGVKTGIEHWRIRKFKTSGTLYWQLNDCWPVASLSCIDYYKRKKALYYYTKRFYRNVCIIPEYKDDMVKVYVINDKLSELEMKISVNVYRLDGTKVCNKEFNALCPPNSSSMVKTFSPEDLNIGYEPLVSYKSIDRTTIPFEYNKELLESVVYVECEVDGQNVCNYMVFERFRYLQLRKPGFNVNVTDNEISLSSPVPAFGVFIETENDVEISDNCLNMEPGKEYVITSPSSPGKVEIFDLSGMVLKLY